MSDEPQSSIFVSGAQYPNFRIRSADIPSQFLDRLRLDPVLLQQAPNEAGIREGCGYEYVSHAGPNADCKSKPEVQRDLTPAASRAATPATPRVVQDSAAAGCPSDKVRQFLPLGKLSAGVWRPPRAIALANTYVRNPLLFDVVRPDPAIRPWSDPLFGTARRATQFWEPGVA